MVDGGWWMTLKNSWSPISRHALASGSLLIAGAVEIEDTEGAMKGSTFTQEQLLGLVVLMDVSCEH